MAHDIMAAIKTYVWEYRDGVLYEELVTFPEGRIFYDNGVVHVDWSHNQGCAPVKASGPMLLTPTPRKRTFIRMPEV